MSWSCGHGRWRFPSSCTSGKMCCQGAPWSVLDRLRVVDQIVDYLAATGAGHVVGLDGDNIEDLYDAAHFRKDIIRIIAVLPTTAFCGVPPNISVEPAKPPIRVTNVARKARKDCANTHVCDPRAAVLPRPPQLQLAPAGWGPVSQRCSQR